MEAKCSFCNKEFKKIGKSVYCSTQCRDEKAKQKRIEKSNEKNKKARKSQNEWGEISRKCREYKCSYGEAVARGLF